MIDRYELIELDDGKSYYLLYEFPTNEDNYNLIVDTNDFSNFHFALIKNNFIEFITEENKIKELILALIRTVSILYE